MTPLGFFRRSFDFGNSRRDPTNEVERELEFHFRETIALLQQQGYGASAAEEEARRRFGDYRRYRTELERLTRRRITLGRLRDSVVAAWQDGKYAVRGLARSPVFSVSAILTLGIGIAATSVMLSLLNGVVFRPLPFPEPGRLVRVYDTQVDRGRLSSSSSPANFVDWRGQQSGFTGMAAHVNARATYTDVAPAVDLLGANVSAEWFSVVGVLPALGRPFTRDEEVFGNHRVVIVSHGFWERFLGADSAAVGRTVSLEGEPHTLIGVMPPGFAFPVSATELWRPLAFDFDVSTSRGVHFVDVIARLDRGVSLESAGASMDVVMNGLRAAYPEQLAGWGVRIIRLRDSLVGDTRSRMFLFLGAVILVLAVAWVNVANLVTARVSSRARELSVRSALGAGRWRLMRLLVVEGMVLTMAAAAAGLALGTWLLDLVTTIGASYVPRLETVAMSGEVALTVFGLSIALGATLGIIPVGRAWRDHLGDNSWARTQSGTGGRAHARLRNGFVIAQISLSLVLAVSAGLLMRSFQTLGSVDPGYQTERALTATVSVPGGRYADDATRAAFFLELTDGLAALPGVVSAAATTQLPLEGYSINFSYWLDGDELPLRDRPNGDFRVVTPGYFDTMGIPVIRGRAFRRDDTADAPPVIVINETLAQRHFSDRDPIGQRIHVSYGGENVPREVVGVVRDVKQRALQVSAAAGYYLPIQQVSWSTMRVVLATDVDPGVLTEALRQTVADLDPLLSVRGIRSLQERFAASVGSPQFNMFLLASMAAIAVVLAVFGVFGITSYNVANQSHEIGVRMALGAEAGAVRHEVSVGAVKLAAVGIGAGLLLSLGAVRLLSNLLFEVSPTDPRTFVLAAVIFVAVAWLGSYVPARRASRVDPVVALRAD